MTRRLSVVALASIVLFGSSSSGFAALTAGQKMAVEAFVKQFSAAEFDTRQKAVDRLIELGPDVVPVVQKSLADTVDAEVKLRCEMVLKGIREAHGAAAVPEMKPETRPDPAPVRGPGVVGRAPAVMRKDPGKFGFDASKVTINVNDAELDTVLQSFADQSGNARIPLPRDWEGKGVTLAVADATYWEALDKLCSSLGFYYTYSFDPQAQTREMRLQPLRGATDVGACAGPVAVKLDSATLTKRFRPGGFRGMGPGGDDGLSLVLSLFTEDRLQPLETDAEVTKIVGADGKEIALEPPQAAADPAAQRGGRGRGGRGAQRMMRGMFGQTGNITATAPNPPVNVEKLASVEGVVRLTFGTGTKELKVSDALNGANRSVTVGNTKLTVTRVQRVGGGRPGRGGPGNGGGGTVLTVRYELDGKAEDLPEFGRGSPYGFALIDPNGEKHTGNANPMATFLMGGRGGFGGPGNPPGNDPNNPRPETGTTTVSFANAPEIDGAWTLVVTLPETLTEREYPFRFTDVSLR